MIASTYKVGQVVFVALQKKAQVFPVLVIEELTKKTIEGSTVEYVVKYGTKTLPMRELEGEIFASADELRRALIERAAASVTELVASAVSLVDRWYPKETLEADHGQDPKIAVKLSDGTTAVIKVPLGLT